MQKRLDASVTSAGWGGVELDLPQPACFCGYPGRWFLARQPNSRIAARLDESKCRGSEAESRIGQIAHDSLLTIYLN